MCFTFYGFRFQALVQQQRGLEESGADIVLGGREGGGSVMLNGPAENERKEEVVGGTRGQTELDVLWWLIGGGGGGGRGGGGGARPPGRRRAFRGVGRGKVVGRKGGRGPWGGGGGEVGGGGGDGSQEEVEEEQLPVRTRAFRAIVRGKVVGKMHMIVSRCPLTLFMSLAASRSQIPSLLLCGEKRHLCSRESKQSFSLLV